jgi:hypothetical protein
MKNLRTFRLLLVGVSLTVGAYPALAQFVPGPNPIGGSAGAQTLTGGTGTINAGGQVSTSGGTVGVTMSGAATLNNNGTIQQTGTGRAIDSTANSANLTVTNTGVITSATSDAFRVNAANSAVSLTNSGTISVIAGGQAIDWAAINTAANSLNNLASGIISAVGDDAVRPGNNGIVVNAGLITATPTGGASPSGSDGIDLRTEKNVTVTNTGTISGRHGIATDGANVGPSSLTVNNNAGTIVALNGSGINVDGVSLAVTANVTNAFGATIQGGVLAAATSGDGDGVDVDGILTLNNSGMILGFGAKGVGGDGLPNNAQAVSIGGGSITNTATGQIIGSSLATDAPNGDFTRSGEGILVDNSSGGDALAATTISNGGLIQGKTGFGIKMVGTFDDTITNDVGGIVRGNGPSATIQTGGGADTVTNRGIVQHDSGGVAIALESGNDILNVFGGAAAILGHIDGGTGVNVMNVRPGTGNTFSFASQVTNFDSVNVGPGTFKLADSATVNAAIVVANGGVLAGTGGVLQSVTLQNGGMISAISGAGILDIGGDLNLQGGSAFRFELGALPGSLGLVAVSGFLNFTGPGSVHFNVFNVGMISGTYELISFAGSNGLSLADLVLDLMPGGFAGHLALDGNSVSLVVTAVPEPATYGLVAAALLLGVAVSRRREKSDRVTR